MRAVDAAIRNVAGGGAFVAFDVGFNRVFSVLVGMAEAPGRLRV